VLVHGGVNFEPYKTRLFESIGGPMAAIETFPHQKAFVAFQDTQQAEGLLLNTNSGIFFEFIPAAELFTATLPYQPERCKSGRELCLIINSNAACGL